MNINLKQLRSLLRVLAKRNVTEFEFEDEHVRLRLTRGDIERGAAIAPQAPPPAAIAIASAPTPAPAPEPSDANLVYVTSPFVGTFYRSPSPDAPSFVEVGSLIREGQALCIIEAMKLMNEITSEYDGEIVSVYVDNGKPVHYGERLFAIKTA
jgi:acetyl-CoA carboxylase biotin carboxyl carrier protein